MFYISTEAKGNSKTKDLNGIIYFYHYLLSSLQVSGQITPLLPYFVATEATNALVNLGSASPPLLLGAHRGFASGFYASAGPRLH